MKNLNVAISQGKQNFLNSDDLITSRIILEAAVLRCSKERKIRRKLTTAFKNQKETIFHSLI